MVCLRPRCSWTSFCHLNCQALHAVANADFLLFLATLDVILVLVVFAVNIILLADYNELFPNAPALIPNFALCSSFSVVFWCSSSISSAWRFLDDPGLSMLGFFASLCSRIPERVVNISSTFSFAPIPVSIAVSFGPLSQADVDETNKFWFLLSLVCWIFSACLKDNPCSFLKPSTNP